MRKGYEGLFGLVRDRLECEPLSGHVFLFSNARRNRLKLLVFDGTGLWVCGKRLEKGCFRWPEPGEGQAKIVLSHEQLAMLLGGISAASAAAALVSQGHGECGSDRINIGQSDCFPQLTSGTDGPS